MSDDGPENLVLRYLRDLDRKMDRLTDDVREVKLRLTTVKEGLTGVRRDMYQLFEGQVRMQHTLDRHGERLDRIERRLELLPA